MIKKTVSFQKRDKKVDDGIVVIKLWIQRGSCWFRNWKVKLIKKTVSFQKRDKKVDDNIVLVLTYHPALKQLYEILRRAQKHFLKSLRLVWRYYWNLETQASFPSGCCWLNWSLKRRGEKPERHRMEWCLASKAATQRCSYEKIFWKYAANLHENTHVEVWF